MRKNKLFIFTLVVFMILFAAVGCRPAEETPPTPTETEDDMMDPTEEETPETIDETPEAGEMNYEDGPYRAELETGERGWTSFVEFTVEDGRIVEVNYDEYDEDNNLKSENEEYNERWEAAAGISAEEAYSALEEQLIQTQDIEAVDTVSGATASTDDFKEAVLQALKGGAEE
ncbi:MAG: FMN-binding protein [Clostridiaceae bacterium]|nr:FMN-binding protein [Clostridiaceae bacterium]